MMKDGQKVSLEYSVFLEDGTQLDSNVGEDPLTIIFGSHQVFPALEQAITSLSVGDTKQVLLAPEDAYGPIIPDAYREVELEAIPVSYRFEGAVLGVQDPQGGLVPIRISQIKEQKAILDFNHPLAGRALRFDLKIVAIQ
ncbi:MAG: FKBP-type peptidyl-prolyl cis-trans isomerase [Chlamydiia bacterium]|nr:FKBP-type peptidyl-prolyl cis-trans isomerase [Chlamydiia bacterium]